LMSCEGYEGKVPKEQVWKVCTDRRGNKKMREGEGRKRKRWNSR